MWPFKRGPRGDQVDARLRAIENQVNALTAALNSQNHGHGMAELVPIVHDIVKANLERAKWMYEGSRIARSASNNRPRDASTGRYLRGPGKEQAAPCRVCVDASNPTLSAQEIIWHSNGHPPGGPGAVRLPTYTNGAME